MKKPSKECLDLIALNLVAGLGPAAVNSLLANVRDTGRIFSMTPKELAEAASISMAVALTVKHIKSSTEFREELDLLKREDIRVTCVFDEDYPSSLLDIYDPPPVLYCKGRLFKKDDVLAAVVGSRRCSLYGMKAAEKISYCLSMKRIIVVSGLARGIDEAAHRGALRAGGRTIAVMGTGFKHIYPRSAQVLAKEICSSGALISEFPCGVGPSKWTFPRRNRIISGISACTVVVEAAKRSGALITADHAIDQGKDVFAVPGPINSLTSEGTNILIRDGAEIVCSPEELANGLSDVYATPFETKVDHSLCRTKNNEITFSGKSTDHKGGNEPEKQRVVCDEMNVLGIIARKEGGVHIDDISGISGLSRGLLHKALIVLELEGAINAMPGKIYVKRPGAEKIYPAISTNTGGDT